MRHRTQPVPVSVPDPRAPGNATSVAREQLKKTRFSFKGAPKNFHPYARAAAADAANPERLLALRPEAPSLAQGGAVRSDVVKWEPAVTLLSWAGSSATTDWEG